MQIELNKKELEKLSNCILCKMQDLSELRHRDFVNQKELEKYMNDLQNLLKKLNK